MQLLNFSACMNNLFTLPRLHSNNIQDDVSLLRSANTTSSFLCLLSILLLALHVLCHGNEALTYCKNRSLVLCDSIHRDLITAMKRIVMFERRDIWQKSIKLVRFEGLTTKLAKLLLQISLSHQAN